MVHDFNVFYHFPCNDGDIARLVWEQKYPNSTFYKWNYSNMEETLYLLNKLPVDIPIIFLDICPSIDKLSENYNYIIIDHHKNAIDEMKNKLHECLIGMKNYRIEMFCDTSKSGCMLTWDYCYHNTNYPTIVHHIGKKDIWDFSNPDTESYTLGWSDYLSSGNQSFRESTNKVLLTDDTIVLHGIFIHRGQKIINRLKEKSEEYFINRTISTETIDCIEYSIIDITCNDSTLYKYLIEYAINQGFNVDVLRVLHTIKDDRNVYSVRSLKEHINVDGIARYYGGNGHPKAAGYTLYK